MKRGFVILLVLLFAFANARAQMLTFEDDSVAVEANFPFCDTVRPVKHPWRAAGEVIATNIVIGCYNRFITQSDFAKINGSTIKSNFETGFVWDTDPFGVNLFGHPYQGGLYFNAARSNGMSFWESYPYAMGGSLMWEYFMENEPPSINDFIVTSIGGAMLGEMTFRLSSLLIDESARGVERVFREIGVAAISPLRGFNRLVTGDSYKYMSRYIDACGYERRPLVLDVSMGYRYLADAQYIMKGNSMLAMGARLTYGAPFLLDDIYEPFDYFDLKATLSVGGNQPFLSSFNAAAILAGKHSEPVPGHRMLIGAFQHFNYYDSEEIHTGEIPYRIGEIASGGAGILYKLPQMNNKAEVSLAMYGNAVILGGCLYDTPVSDSIVGRDYNLGSGFSGKVEVSATLRRIGGFTLSAYHLSLYSWATSNNQQSIYGAQSLAAGYSTFNIINPRFDFNITKAIRLSFEGVFYYRLAAYENEPDVSTKTVEIRSMLTYKF